jgi:Trypsin
MCKLLACITAIAVVAATCISDVATSQPHNKLPYLAHAARFDLAYRMEKLPDSGDTAFVLPVQLDPRRSLDEGELKYTGSTTVPDDSFRYVVKIAFKNGRGQDDYCTGIAVDRTFTRVLTAAHCTCERLETYTILRQNSKDPGNALVPMAPPVRFPGYSCSLPLERQGGRDLALMWVAEEVTLALPLKNMEPNFRLKPLKIATMHHIYRDAVRLLVGVGYGYDETGATPKKNANAAVIPIQSYFCSSGSFARSACASFREFVLANTDASLGNNRPDSCGGDSGSPIFRVDPASVANHAVIQEEEQPLVGITSRALEGVQHNPGTTCGGGGIYTALGHPEVIEWLRSHGVISVMTFGKTGKN